MDTYSTTSQYQSEVFQLTGLSNTAHTIEVRLSGQTNAASTDYWIGLDYFVSQ